MKKEYEKILENLKNSISVIEEKGISIHDLNDSYEELAKHTKEIKQIEDNIDAIKSQVIDSIKKELDQNKKSSIFSIYGFWIGLIALVLSIVASISNFRIKPVETEKKINIINERIANLSYRILGIDESYSTREKTFLIEKGVFKKPTPILYNYNNNDTLSIDLIETEEVKWEDGIYKPIANIIVYINSRQMGLTGLQKIYSQNNSDSFNFERNSQTIQVFENDTISFLSNHFVVKKIFRKTTKMYDVGHKKNAILLEKI
ncbi:hypothetical protein FVB32_01000 [Flagellimonas hymeniacidonis]|uniref:Uncharacterized protein n=1 Tax=Flagellimonas hymeniacidonis TaxID=2603628 RepID=A0A5C8V4S9_9FLAO|nr:hypothetical protein [Flagellimonas hymeniacidonis]TXN36895.1 hypothetical protein FVB32_01000 [Flagellimonas hymeniacidonis]